ncbi:MAG: ABC transporter substrate-binding protein [Candidatus Merdivicinus sp.]
MKRLATFLAALTAAAVLASCGSGGNSSLLESSEPIAASQETSSAPVSSAAEPSEGGLPEIYDPAYAKGFTIEYYSGGAKIIATDIPATASTQAFSQRLLLLPEGAEEPRDTQWDHVIEGDITSVVTLASAHAGHFANVDAIDLVKGCSIEAEKCYVPALKTALEAGDTVYVGSSSKADPELIASLAPQIVFVGGMASDVEVAQKLEESGIFCLYFGDFAEEDFLGRAQWIELIGAVAGKDEEARSFVTENVAEIDGITEKIQAAGEKPKVLWFTHSSSEPHWNLRTSQDYVNSIVEAAGGELLFPEGTESNSVKLSNEDFLQYINEADCIVFGVSLNSYPDAGDITFFNKEGQIDFAACPAFQNGRCYVVGYDWAQDTANAAEIVRSAAARFYPELFADETEENLSKVIPFSGK